MRKWKDPDSDPYLWLTDLDPEGPKQHAIRIPITVIIPVQGSSLLGAALLLWREVQERGRASRGIQAHRQQPPTRQGAACQGNIHKDVKLPIKL